MSFSLTNAQMQAVINAGGSVIWPPNSGARITTIAGLPSDAAIAAYFAVNPTVTPALARKKVGVPSSSASEVQGIYPLGTVSGGSFKLANVPLTAGGAGTTGAIAIPATSAAINTALVAIGAAVAVSTNATTTTGSNLIIAITFTGVAANAPQSLITVDNSLVTGGGTLNIVRLVAGAAGDFVGAAVGDPVQDSTTGADYRNQGTATAPVWTPPRISVLPSGNDMIAALGDSITQGGGIDFPETHQTRDWLDLMCVRSKGRFAPTRLAGVASDTTAQILARVFQIIYPVDVMSGVALPKPRYCAVLAGINDIQSSVPAATTKANLVAIWTALRNAGIEPIACLLTPYGNATVGTQNTNQQQVAALNAWIAHYCATLANPIKVVDFYSTLIDPTNGRYASGFDSGDFIHPSAAGADRMAQVLNDRLTGSGTYAHMGHYLACATNDWTGTGPSLIANGNWLIDTNSDGLADGWTAGSGTATLVAATAPDLGNYQSFAWTTNGGQISKSVSSGFAAGDRLKFTTTINATPGAGVSVIWFFFSGANTRQSSVQRFYGTSVPVGSLLSFEFIVPPGTTSMSLINTANGTPTVAAIGQTTLINLTAMGLA